jgi:DNA-binding LacI/PurR family transcriptional regulator
LSGYDGFFLSVVAGEVADLDRLSLDTPVVLIGEKAVPARFDHVIMDNVGGARMATEPLIRSGARRIALLAGVPEETMPGLRTRGYRDAHAATGTAVCEELIVSCGFGVDHGYEAVRDLVGRGVEFAFVGPYLMVGPVTPAGVTMNGMTSGGPQGRARRPGRRIYNTGT